MPGPHRGTVVVPRVDDPTQARPADHRIHTSFSPADAERLSYSAACPSCGLPATWHVKRLSIVETGVLAAIDCPTPSCPPATDGLPHVPLR